MRKSAIAIVALVILVLIALWTRDYLNGGRRPEYSAVFLSVPGVEEVSYFLWYEEHTSAGLELTGGRHLHIAEFDEAVGTSTDDIGLVQIGDLQVSCSTTAERSDIVAGGFNVIAVMASSPLQLRLRNIGDVVSHYDEIYGYIEESLPLERYDAERDIGWGAEAKQVNMGSHSYWCSRYFYTNRARN
jgi:hypothetical protein